jgi:hypothetical protein
LGIDGARAQHSAGSQGSAAQRRGQGGTQQSVLAALPATVFFLPFQA